MIVYRLQNKNENVNVNDNVNEKGLEFTVLNESK